MNRSSAGRKPSIAIVLTLAAVFLAGCASHYPYSGSGGVYYGKSYDRYGHGYNRHYGHAGYRYNYYRRDYVHLYSPWHSGYGRSYYGRTYYARPYYYSRPYYRGPERGDDHHHDHDTANRSGDAARELRQVTDQQRRRALLQRSEPRQRATINSQGSTRQAPATSSNRPATNSARDQLRRSIPSRSDGGNQPKPVKRGGIGTKPHDGGGMRTPEKRRK